MTMLDIIVEKRYREFDRNDLTAKKIKTLEEVINSLIESLILLLFILMVFNLGYIVNIYETASICEIVLHTGEAIIYGCIMVILYIIRRTLVA